MMQKSKYISLAHSPCQIHVILSHPPEQVKTLSENGLKSVGLGVIIKNTVLDPTGGFGLHEVSGSITGAGGLKPEDCSA